jgi:ABC-type transport system substrate-binding protein
MKRTTKIAASLTTLTLAVLLTACSTPVTEQPAASAPAAAEDAAETPAAPPAEETKAPEQGTRTNPFPKGTTVGTDKVQLVLGEPVWNATDAVAAANQFNEAAPEGSTYAILPVTVTNVSDPDAVQPWLAFTIKFVSDDGRTFEQQFSVIDTPLTDVGDLYPGGVGTGNLLFALPNDVSAGGAWVVEETLAFGDPVFIAAH